MQFADMYPSKYLSSADVKQAGGTIIDTIESVTQEEMQSTRGGRQVKPVAYLRSNKPLILNKTNGTKLMLLLGGETDAWKGCRVKLGVEQVQSPTGGLTDGVRIKDAKRPGPPAPVAPAPAPLPPKPEPQFAPADFDDEIPF